MKSIFFLPKAAMNDFLEEKYIIRRSLTPVSVILEGTFAIFKKEEVLDLFQPTSDCSDRNTFSNYNF